MSSSDRSYYILGWAGLILWIASFFYKGHFVDLRIEETYYMISSSKFFLAIALLFMLVCLVYSLTADLLWSKFLAEVHVLFTFFTSMTLLAYIFWLNFYNETFNMLNESDLHQFLRTNDMLSSTAQFLVWGQLFYVVNLLGGLVKRTSHHIKDAV